jgi:DMSO/TMAO reductase YedYZ molybdopterin-dependent catalytic subunit
MIRRKFIIAAAAGGIGLLEYSTVSRWMNALAYPSNVSIQGYERFGEKAALMAITPNNDFYVTSKGMTPSVNIAEWRLKVDGLVENPLTLTYHDLLALPKIEKVMTLECISDPVGGNAIGNAKWTGTALKPLIERAKPKPEAAYAVVYAADGFSSGHPMDRFWNEENFIAYQMNGDDLPPIHGYPARIFIPGKFGMKQPKWMTRIEFVNQAYLGYWESQGWSDDCERFAHARFTDIRDGAKIKGKNFELTGYALANHAGIKAVQISFDDGQSWQATNLYSNPSPIVWSFWKYIWIDPKRGDYKIRVRAIDGQNRVEGWDPRDPFPAGATGQQAIEVTVV